MENIRRIDGLKYRVDELSLDELRTINGYLLARHVELTSDIDFVETEMMRRTHPELPFEANGAAMDPGFNYETYTEATRGC